MMRPRFFGLLVLMLLIASTLLLPMTYAAPVSQEDAVVEGGEGNDTVLVSTGVGGQGNGDSLQSSISADGRYVLFTSVSTNLVTTDTNASADIFLRDVISDTTVRISRRTAAVQGNDSSFAGVMTPDATSFVFGSLATNLVATDTNAASDIFYVTRNNAGTITAPTRVSVSTQGVQANGPSFFADISEDGEHIVFDSEATNLVAVDDNNASDIFWRNMVNNTVTKISISNNNSPGDGRSERPLINQDGTYAVYYSYATNLVVGDTNDQPDIFGVDLITFDVERLNISTSGQQAPTGALAEFAISSDGRYLVFASDSNLATGSNPNTVNIYLRDIEARTTRLISRSATGTAANADAFFPTISPDGRYAGFHSAADNLDGEDKNEISDTFVVELRSNYIRRVSTAADGTDTDAASGPPSFSGDGSFITFESLATNIVAGDTNDAPDVFLRDYRPLIPLPTYAPLVTRNYQAQPCLSSDIEPNNGTNDANNYPRMCQGVALAGTLPGNDPEDYYYFLLDSSAGVRIDLFGIPSRSDFDLYLYNSDLILIGRSDRTGNATESISAGTLASGRYYIRVYPRSRDGGGNYQLRWVR